MGSLVALYVDCVGHYGLKQSPRAWSGKFSTVIHDFGMIHSEVDHFVFYRHSATNLCIYLMVYVDHIVIISNSIKGKKRK